MIFRRARFMIAAVSYFFQLFTLFFNFLFLYRHGVDIYNLFSGLFSASPLTD
jgi:hypothetical protein